MDISQLACKKDRNALLIPVLLNTAASILLSKAANDSLSKISPWLAWAQYAGNNQGGKQQASFFVPRYAEDPPHQAQYAITVAYWQYTSS